MLASHWIAQELLDSMDDAKKLVSLARKFSKHYPNDKELVDICKEINRYMKKPDDAKKKEIESKLKKLVRIRKIGGSGGTGLWYKDVRAPESKGKMR